MDVSGVRGVIEADERELAGHLDARTAGGVNDERRGVVVGADEGGERPPTLLQRDPQAIQVHADIEILRGQAMLPHRIHIAGTPEIEVAIDPGWRSGEPDGA